MKILHVVPTYLPALRYGGPIHSVHGLCKALVKQGHEIDVFTTNVDGASDSDVPLASPVNLDGVKIWYFKSKWLRRIYYSEGMDNALGDISRYDLVHIHSVFLWPTVAASEHAKKARIPYIISPRGMLDPELIRRKSYLLKTLWITLLGNKIINDAEAIHVTSEYEKNELKKFNFNLPRIINIPNGVLIDRDEPIKYVDKKKSQEVSEILSSDRSYILCLGRLSWKKGLDRLITALNHVSKIDLVIAGNDEERLMPKLKKKVKEEELCDRIKFTGPVYGADKWNLYKKATVFVLPSYSENFGNVVLEAMAVGCPVIVTQEVGLASEIKATNCGIVSAGDPEALGAAIKKLLADHELLKSMSENCIQIVKEKYAWDVVASQMGKYYEQILEKRNEKMSC